MVGDIALAVDRLDQTASDDDRRYVGLFAGGVEDRGSYNRQVGGSNVADQNQQQDER